MTACQVEQIGPQGPPGARGSRWEGLCSQGQAAGDQQPANVLPGEICAPAAAPLSWNPQGEGPWRVPWGASCHRVLKPPAGFRGSLHQGVGRSRSRVDRGLRFAAAHAPGPPRAAKRQPDPTANRRTAASIPLMAEVCSAAAGSAACSAFDEAALHDPAHGWMRTVQIEWPCRNSRGRC